MRGRHIKWLLTELPELVSSGVLNLDVAARLEAHYSAGVGPRRRWVAIGLGVLGAALIGLGVAMLLAHNWDRLERPARLLISMGLLVAAQSLSAWSLLRRPGAVAWREATATGLVLAVGASMALVTQTYHLDLDFEQFVGLWTLLALPVVYVQASRVAAALAWSGIVWTALVGNWAIDEATIFWGLALTMLPYTAHAFRAARADALAALPLWTAAIALALAGLALSPFGDPNLWVLHLSAMFAGIYVLGEWAGDRGASPWRRPFELVGALGSSVLALVLSFGDPWSPSAFLSGDVSTARMAAILTVSTLALAAAVVGGARAVSRGRWTTLLLCGFPAVAAAGLALIGAGAPPRYAALLASGWMLATGLTALICGAREGEIGTANTGMALLAALAVARFGDFDISLVGRGVAFVSVGVAFLALNVVLQRARLGRLS